MIPLLRDPMFDAMAVAMMSGLILATCLTLFIVPVLYTLFFNIHPDREQKPAAAPLNTPVIPQEQPVTPNVEAK